MKRRQPVPDIIADAPSLKEDLGDIWDAYQRLSSCRPMGFGALGPIPWWAVDRYAERLGYVDEGYLYLVELIEEMDAEFQDWQSSNLTTTTNS